MSALQRRKASIVVMLCVLALAFSVNLVHAANANTASVCATSDAAGNTKANFWSTPSTIYIWWTAQQADGTPGTVDIEIQDSAGNTVVGPILNQPMGAQPIIWNAPVGYYYLVVKGSAGVASYKYPIAVASVFIIPESLLGTLMATVAGFAAFGAIRLKRVKNKN